MAVLWCGRSGRTVPDLEDECRNPVREAHQRRVRDEPVIDIDDGD